MENAIAIVFQLAILIFSVVIHEVSHGLAANALGDPTAKYAGRLTLNPIKHLDPVGSFLIPVASYLIGGFVIGWAKPVPYNPYHFQMRNRDLGSAIVGAAGPGANILVAVVFGLLVRAEGAWAPMMGGAGGALVDVMGIVALTNLVLAVFNLVPIPPLDGSKVLFALLPPGLEPVRAFLENYGFFVLLVFIFYLSNWILPVVSVLFRFLTGMGF